MKIEEKQLPNDWEMKKLGEMCEVIMGQSPPSSTYNSKGIGLPFFQGKAEFTELHPLVKKWCNSPSKIALPDDILLSVRAPVGSTNIADQKCCIGRGLAAIRYKNYKYVFYFLRLIERQLDKKGTGTTFRAISGAVLRSIEIPVPSLAEQQAIVAKIEELFVELENGKQELLTAQAKLKTYRQSLLKSAFEGRLTNKNLKDGELPKDWEIKKLGEVCKIQTGKYDANHAKPNGKYRFYTCAFEWMLCNTNRFSGESIILPGNGANVGEVFYYNGEFDAYQRTYVLNDFIRVSPKFLYHHLHRYWKKRNQGKQFGSATNYIRMGNFTDYEIPVPPLVEQQSIVAILESKLTICDKIEETINASLKQAEILRQSILQKAFRGELINKKTSR